MPWTSITCRGSRAALPTWYSPCVAARLFSALLKYWRGRRGLSQLDLALHAIPGVSGTGLFIKMAHTVMIQEGDKVEVRRGA